MFLCFCRLVLFSYIIFCVADAQPTEGEREVWDQVNTVLQDSESILSGLQAYKGAGQEIRDVRIPNDHIHRFFYVFEIVKNPKIFFSYFCRRFKTQTT